MAKSTYNIMLIYKYVINIYSAKYFWKILESKQLALSNKLTSFTVKLKDILEGYDVIRSYSLKGNLTMGLILGYYSNYNGDIKFDGKNNS